MARELAAATGESLTEAVLNALKERLARHRGRVHAVRLEDELLAIGRRCADLPVLDDRAPEDIIGYDERGLPRRW